MDQVSGTSRGAVPVTVRAPATSANLGPGFDSCGLALALYDTVQATTTRAGIEIAVAGEGESDVPRDERNLIVRALRATFDVLGVPQPGLRLACRNRVPHARGLGSSAAAIVSGIRLGEALSGGDLAPEEDLQLAAALEGHPDNVAACLLGGFTIAWFGTRAAEGKQKDVAAVRLEVHPDVRPVVFVPPYRLSTEQARAALPTIVTHAEAARTASRAALLTVALTRIPDRLYEATEEWLHQGFRGSMMAASRDLLDRLRSAGIPAVISGAGPSILAFATRASPLEPRDWLPGGWRIIDVPVASSGAFTDPTEYRE